MTYLWPSSVRNSMCICDRLGGLMADWPQCGGTLFYFSCWSLLSSVCAASPHCFRRSRLWLPGQIKKQRQQEGGVFLRDASHTDPNRASSRPHENWGVLNFISGEERDGECVRRWRSGTRADVGRRIRLRRQWARFSVCEQRKTTKQNRKPANPFHLAADCHWLSLITGRTSRAVAFLPLMADVHNNSNNNNNDIKLLSLCAPDKNSYWRAFLLSRWLLCLCVCVCVAFYPE